MLAYKRHYTHDATEVAIVEGIEVATDGDIDADIADMGMDATAVGLASDLALIGHITAAIDIGVDLIGVLVMATRLTGAIIMAQDHADTTHTATVMIEESYTGKLSTIHHSRFA